MYTVSSDLDLPFIYPLLQVIACCPGLVKTPGHVDAAKEVDDMLLAKMPMGRFGIPDEITDGIIFA
jgi:NAD(P)-dependent dehydrogenase (short-subunit alcohol dehydrogenase family)